ncbi:MAG: bifunctional enoyl-CoA hydratase/phosphate acetyltransferase [bacterium]|nr:bifunctional enoyl-CoA hydratase/phosphate acetyltransferase [bacterium]
MMHTMPGFDALMRPIDDLTPPVVAVVQPVSDEALTGILAALDARLVRAVLVGERPRIAAGLRALGRSEGEFEIEHASGDQDAAARAVALVRDGAAQILMKGHIHTDDFLKPAVESARGLRTDRRMSHAFVCYLPEPAYRKPLTVTDGAMNVAPDVEAKAGILENAIELMHALGTAQPKVAILAAVETVNPAMQATLDAAQLQARAARGAFASATVEGPLAFDNAISLKAAQTKGIASSVAGDPDVLLVPDIEAGNILYKTLVYLCGAIAPGIVMGALAPILLTSRADPPLARTASCALAARLVRYRQSLGG